MLLVKRLIAKKGEPGVVIELEDGRIFVLGHEQDCCESVTVEDVCGDPELFAGQELREYYRSASGVEDLGDWDGDRQWTFFILRCLKETLVIRFFGESNGYYSTDARLYQAYLEELDEEHWCFKECINGVDYWLKEVEDHELLNL